jgi:hypothetical protein
MNDVRELKTLVTMSRWACVCDMPGDRAPRGLVLEHVAHDNFDLAREIRVAKIWINPDSPDPSLRRELLLGEPDFELDGGVTNATTAAPRPFDAYGVEGTLQQKYVSAVVPGHRVFGEGKPPLLVTQTYRFGTYGNDPPHEPVGTLPAARLFPHLSFQTTNALIASIRVDYRLQVAFSGRSWRSQAGIFRDRDELPGAPVLAAFQLQEEAFDAVRELLERADAIAATLEEVDLRHEFRQAIEDVDRLPVLPRLPPELSNVIREQVHLGVRITASLVRGLITVLRGLVESQYQQSPTVRARLALRIAQSVVPGLITQQLFAAAEKPIHYEIAAVGLDDGNHEKTWDNIHMWPRGEGEEALPSTPGAFHALHLHWRWGTAAALPTPIEALAQKWLGIQKAGASVLSVAGGPLIDENLPLQTIRFAIVRSERDIRPDRLFESSYAGRDPEVVRDGADFVLWMCFEARRGSASTFQGTVFVHGLYFPHEPESDENPFAFSLGQEIEPDSSEAKWHRQPKE